MRIAVECEACGHVGPEFVLAHMNDTSAALSAARAFSSPSAARRFLLPARPRCSELRLGARRNHAQGFPSIDVIERVDPEGSRLASTPRGPNKTHRR